MARNIYTADLAKGLVTPFPDNSPVEIDKYSSSGAFMPQLQVLDIVNAMPTVAGYMSYFGNEAQVGQIVGETYIQDVIVVRTFNGIMLLVAMCPTGLWLCCPASQSTGTLTTVTPVPTVTHLTARKTIALVNNGFAWLKVAACANPSPNPWKWWTFAILKNKLYFYQQGLGAIVEIADTVLQQIVINWYNPTSIIGTANCHTEIVHSVLNSGCTTTQQSMSFGSALLPVTLTNLNKAHIAAVAPELWAEKIIALMGAQVRVVV
jgi:hypothetical protein